MGYPIRTLGWMGKLMIGYIYIDLDGNLVRKDSDYIDTMNPNFFLENKHLIVRIWKFDSDNKDAMIAMLRTFKDLLVDSSRTILFLRDIGFDINSLKDPGKDNANKV